MSVPKSRGAANFTGVVGWVWAVFAWIMSVGATNNGTWLAAVLLAASGLISARIAPIRARLTSLHVGRFGIGTVSAVLAVIGFVAIGSDASSPEAKAAQAKRDLDRVAQANREKAEQDANDRSTRLEAARIKEKETKVAADKLAAEAEERKSGLHCLSSWDGSHRNLVASFKEGLRDPDTFEHIETRITPTDKEGNHALMMKYRARNGFGGMNVGQLIATVKDSDCSFTVLANQDS